MSNKQIYLWYIIGGAIIGTVIPPLLPIFILGGFALPFLLQNNK